jgi:hypothetical protein
VLCASQSEEEWDDWSGGRIFKLFKEPKNRFQGINSASLCILAGRYDNPIPTRLLAPIDCLKIPARITGSYISLVLLRKEWIGWRNSSRGGRYIEWKGVKHWPPPESIEFFLEDHDFSSPYVLAPLPSTVSKLSLFHILHMCVAGRAYWRESRRRQRESLVLSKSFNILWPPTLSAGCAENHDWMYPRKWW